MSLSLRFILPLFFVLGLIAYVTIPLVDKLTYQWFARDIDIRAALVANTLSDSLAAAQGLSNRKQRLAKIESIFASTTQDERLFAVAYCNSQAQILAQSQQFPKEVTCTRDPKQSGSKILQLPGGPLHISYQPLPDLESQLVLVHDLSFVQTRSTDTKRYLFVFFVILTLVVSFLTVVIAKLSLMGWIRGLKSILKVDRLSKSSVKSLAPELLPVAKDLRRFVREIEAEKGFQDESQISWTAQTLREVLKQDMAGEEVLIVSNREPYIHVYQDNKIEIQSPASGLVTALEPIMRACSGTWIAHGSGTGDRMVVDAHSKVPVPPKKPSYSLKRVWLSPEQEKGYYYGFANEGLWPLCHIAHTRPIFRSDDWYQYLAVNEKFADAVAEEAKSKDPVILVQDYHFAMLPTMIKKRLPEATVITFWHIPWPNAETFGICPWRERILEGLLGSDILGFHTRAHCNNFIEAVDRFLESRIERDSSIIFHGEQRTAIRNYPISIEWPLKNLDEQDPVPLCRQKVLEENHIAPECFLGVGVDRLDYTKGILERFYAIERLLELEPSLRGRLVFIQIGAPTRSSLAEYRNFEEHCRVEAERINQRFGQGDYKPLVLRLKHHDPSDVIRYFRAADFCFVSSLHDGMNLVAKEFVASRDDEMGVLILSQFTGAARELPEALVINPYNIDQGAAAVKLAIEMDPQDQRARMRSMRAFIQEYNVFRWAGRMLIDAARLRKRGRFANPVLNT
ncbi:MAG: trehalose-6-phosphate synthase [Pseudobdellovibrionaceae bacterium]